MLQIGVRIMTTEHIDDSFWSLGFRKGVCVVLGLFTESRRFEKHIGWIPCCIVPRRFVGRIGDIQLQLDVDRGDKGSLSFFESFCCVMKDYNTGDIYASKLNNVVVIVTSSFLIVFKNQKIGHLLYCLALTSRDPTRLQSASRGKARLRSSSSASFHFIGD
jgi:hypothetical protein